MSEKNTKVIVVKLVGKITINLDSAEDYRSIAETLEGLEQTMQGYGEVISIDTEVES